VAIQILKNRRQVTPCYGGLSNIHLNYNGDIWPCCILGSEKNLGNVRAWKYDISALLSSDQARKSKQYIAAKNCACPLANQWLINVLLTPRHMLRALYTYLVRFPLSKKPSVEKTTQPVDPKAVRVHITGTSARKAIVLSRAGTIPSPRSADLPEFNQNNSTQRSMRLINVASPAEKLPAHRVENVRRLTESTYVLRVARKEVEFTPGQYFSINPKGNFEAREYTIYSSSDDDFLEFLITEVDGGAVSPELKKCVAGDILELEGPMGYFHLDKASYRKSGHCFIATGTGIAPYHSFVGSFQDLDYSLVHGVRFAGDCYDVQHYDPDRYIQCVSREQAGNFQGRVTDFIRQHPVDPDMLFYLCGNCEMLFEAYDILVEQGVARHNIMTEVFY